MNAVPMTETARAAVGRIFADELAQGYRVAGCHRYNAADGTELFRVVRLKHAERDKVIIPIHRDGFRYRKGRGARPDAGWLLYVPPYPLVDTNPVYVIEDEACADALARLGVAATGLALGTVRGCSTCSPPSPHSLSTDPTVRL